MQTFEDQWWQLEEDSLYRAETVGEELECSIIAHNYVDVDVLLESRVAGHNAAQVSGILALTAGS